MVRDSKYSNHTSSNSTIGANPTGEYMRTTQGAATIPASLLSSDRNVFFKTRPQYEAYAASRA